MSSKVYFTNLRTTPGKGLLEKLERLLYRAGIAELPCKDRFTALKLHFGEPGNMAFLRPNYVNRIVEVLQKQGAKVFLTDANTLYSGGRSNAPDHLLAASSHGFNLLQVKAPVIVADGLKGTEYRELPVRGGELCTTAKIGSAVADADVIVSVTHFKGHEMTGFGGTLKNLGMGAASVGGKLQLHSDSQPYIDAAQCKGCMLCVRACAHGALSLNAQRIAQIDYHRCVGCGQCVAVCQHNAARVENNTTSKNLNYKIAEYTQAILQDKPHFHISFIMNVSPECDCWASNDAAIVPDLGMAASFDPVALDMACAHLVMGAPILKDSALHTRALQAAVPAAEPKDCGCKHHDKFKLLHPDTDWRSGLEHAQKLGLGTMDFQLEII